MSVLSTITDYLTGKGFSRAQIAGIEGNLQVESGLDPAAYNPSEGAIGLAQWEGGRRAALQAFARSKGGSETDLYTQLDYMWSELQGSENPALRALLATTTPADAATVWDQKYERSAGTSRQKRIDAANNLYNGINLPQGGGGGGGKTTKGGQANGTSVGDVLIGLVPGLGVMQAVDEKTSGLLGGVLGIATKVLLTGAAVALVVTGVVNTVKDGTS